MPGLLLLFAVAAILGLAAAPSGAARPKVDIPPDFPLFSVPGQERAMAELRELLWTHYERGGPLATLWDEWESGPTLWPAVSADDRMNTIRERWRAALLGRNIDDEGYVSTHQHASIAHQDGWPFPFWQQGRHGWGWHFALPEVPPGFGVKDKGDQRGWSLEAPATWALTPPRGTWS
jgi:hypothetical protein